MIFIKFIRAYCKNQGMQVESLADVCRNDYTVNALFSKHGMIPGVARTYCRGLWDRILIYVCRDNYA